VPLAQNSKSEMVPAEAERAYAGEYPLARMLLVYVNHQPGTALDPLRREFLRYVYSRQGQSDVVRSGYLPIGQELASKSLASVGIK